jgi:phage head maturation protease
VSARKGKTGGRHLTELELWEVSVVTFPMLPEARVGAKGDEPESLMRDLAAAFQDARHMLTRD